MVTTWLIWFDLKSTYLQDHKRKSNKQRLWKPKLQKLDLLGYGKLKSKEQTRTANSAKPKLQNLTFESSSRKNKPGLRKPKLQKPDLWKLKSKEQQLTHSHLPHWLGLMQKPKLQKKNRPMKAQVERTAAAPEPSASSLHWQWSVAKP